MARLDQVKLGHPQNRQPAQIPDIRHELYEVPTTGAGQGQERNRQQQGELGEEDEI
jgi:hypothetical protein